MGMNPTQQAHIASLTNPIAQAPQSTVLPIQRAYAPKMRGGFSTTALSELNNRVMTGTVAGVPLWAIIAVAIIALILLIM